DLLGGPDGRPRAAAREVVAGDAGQSGRLLPPQPRRPARPPRRQPDGLRREPVPPGPQRGAQLVVDALSLVHACIVGSPAPVAGLAGWYCWSYRNPFPGWSRRTRRG